MNPQELSESDYLDHITPILVRLILGEEPDLEKDAIYQLLESCSFTCLNIKAKAHKVNVVHRSFLTKVAREQVLIRRATKGTPVQQARAMSAIMENYERNVRQYLHSFSFRVSDRIDDVVSETFTTFYKLLEQGKPVVSLMQTILIGIARRIALHYLREDKKTGDTQWLETVYAPVDDEGEPDGITLPVYADDDDAPESVDLHLPAGDGNLTTCRVEYRRLQAAIRDCFDRLNERRQLLIRLKTDFWQELSELPSDIHMPVVAGEKLTMDQIAVLCGYQNAHTASVRLNESYNMLKKCLREKLVI